MNSTLPILVSGFEPFGGDEVNPSADIALALHGAQILGAPIHSCILPCTFSNSIELLHHAIDSVHPQLVLCLGQSSGRIGLSLERVAINVIDARIADNAGAQPIDQPVMPNGPAAYFSTLPIKAMAAELRACGVPVSISQSAGTFVCNHVFYGLMHRLATHFQTRGGFMHVPMLPQQTARHPGEACLPLDTMVAGVRVAIERAMRTQLDLNETGGEFA